MSSGSQVIRRSTRISNHRLQSILKMSTEPQLIHTTVCQDSTFHIVLTVLGQEFSAMVDTGCSNSIMSTATVAAMNLTQLMDTSEKLASCVT